MSDADTTPPIEFLAVWWQALAHQRTHRPELVDLLAQWMEPKPTRLCTRCLIEHTAGDDGYYDQARHYAWAVPTEQALDALARWSPRGMVEIGAGGGYWAMLLRQRGVDVVAYDPDPAGLGHPYSWHDGTCWSPVLTGDHTVAARHPDRTLFLCWPESGQAWPADTVRGYGGDTVIYVGERGVTGNHDFHSLLDAQFEVVEEVGLPHWMGTSDDLFVYTRVHSEHRSGTQNPAPASETVTEPQPETAGESDQDRPITLGTSGDVELTDAVVERLAGDAERGYEPHQFRKRDGTNPR